MSDIVERLRRTSFPITVGPEEAAREIERLRTQVAELEMDAGRYRWLQNSTEDDVDSVGIAFIWNSTKHGKSLSTERIDEIIDAAMAAKKGKP